MSGKNRAVRVVTLCLDEVRGKSDPDVVAYTLNQMDLAAVHGPDILCLPETFVATAEEVPGPVIERLGGWAREHSCWVIAGISTLVEERRFNSAVLLDRQGEVAGRYDKIYVTENELNKGATPGATDPPVFHTDFGTIGVQICFDVNWHAAWRRLKENGAEIVFWPSAYAAPRHLSTLAWFNQYYVASATLSGTSRIFDITGDVLSASGARTQWTDAVVHLSKRLFEIDFHVTKVREIQARYGERVQVVWQHEDDWFTLASLDPELAVEEIIAEYELTPLTDYLARAGTANDRARNQ